MQCPNCIQETPRGRHSASRSEVPPRLIIRREPLAHAAIHDDLWYAPPSILPISVSSLLWSSPRPAWALKAPRL